MELPHALFAAVLVFILVFRTFVGMGGIEVGRGHGDLSPNGAYAKLLCGPEGSDPTKWPTPADHVCSDCLRCVDRTFDASPLGAIPQAQEIGSDFLESSSRLKFAWAPGALTGKPLGWKSSWSSRGSPASA